MKKAIKKPAAKTPAKSNNNLLYLGLAGVIGLYAFGKNKEVKPIDVKIKPIDVKPIEPIKVSNPTPQAPKSDPNKVVGFGSRGLEVGLLQKLLKIKIDGIFGDDTLAALKKAKGVSSISLAQFNTTANATSGSGKNIQTQGLTDVPIFEAKTFGTEFMVGAVSYYSKPGQLIGNIIKTSKDGKNLLFERPMDLEFNSISPNKKFYVVRKSDVITY